MLIDHTRSSTGRKTKVNLREDRSGERGAVLVHVAIALVGLMSFSALVVDYGVLWLSRRQAQNAADAGALAGAVSLGFVDDEDQDLARTSAINTALENYIFGETPDILDTDVTFPTCPPGSPGAGVQTCIRVDVFRNQRPGGKPLPTFFGNLFGVTDQGVKATATAEVLYGSAADCVKPFAVPDKWREFNPELVEPENFWDEVREFSRYFQNGPDAGTVMDPADVYELPINLQPEGHVNVYGDAGTGFTPASVTDPNGDYGRQMVLKSGGPSSAIAPGWYHPVTINPIEGPGGDVYRENIADCDTTRIRPGTLLDIEPGNMVGPTTQGLEILMAKDPDASWGVIDATTTPPTMGIVDSCCRVSPRLVAIPVFNPDEYDAGRASGRQTIQITKVLGFFVEGYDNNGDITGRIMTYPTSFEEGDDLVKDAAFVISIALVR